MLNRYTTKQIDSVSPEPHSKTSFVKQPFNKVKHVGFKRDINYHILLFIVAVYLLMTANLGFFSQVTHSYPLQYNFGFFVSIAGLLLGLIILVLELISNKYTVKTVLIIMVIIAAVCGYFTDTYGTIFDSNMLTNGLETDHAEAADLLSPIFLIRILLLGILPAFIIFKIKLKQVPLKWAVLQKGAGILLSLALIGFSIIPFGDQYASFFREHKQIRYYANPITPLYSSVKLGTDLINDMQRPDTLIVHAVDAKHVLANDGNGSSLDGSPVSSKPKLMVFVVGEAVRADHIGLNGYERNTTPLLSKNPDVYSFKNATSCGTSTAYSVPCMFSYADQRDYDMDLAKYNENVLDTLSKQGVKVIWRDNNSSSKGVADRVTYEDFKTSKTNPVCDIECRDIGMLNRFGDLVKSGATSQANTSQANSSQDTLIILHQMGNHGPAYYKRYPKDFEAYTPVCINSELAKCDSQEVINAYDNAIRYSDYFLNTVIETLKPYEEDYDVVMVYVSDHGESLGENNIYLHGMPYKFAPKAQKNVPIIIWSPSSNHIDSSSLARQLNKPVSHDYITPTLLKFFNISTAEVANKPVLF